MKKLTLFFGLLLVNVITFSQNPTVPAAKENNGMVSLATNLKNILLDPKFAVDLGNSLKHLLSTYAKKLSQADKQAAKDLIESIKELATLQMKSPSQLTDAEQKRARELTDKFGPFVMSFMMLFAADADKIQKAGKEYSDTILNAVEQSLQ